MRTLSASYNSYNLFSAEHGDPTGWPATTGDNRTQKPVYRSAMRTNSTLFSGRLDAENAEKRME
jgi:hypothetical protein